MRNMICLPPMFKSGHVSHRLLLALNGSFFNQMPVISPVSLQGGSRTRSSDKNMASEMAESVKRANLLNGTSQQAGLVSPFI